MSNIIPDKDGRGWPMVVPNDGGIRPAGPADECFYCDQKVGTPHKDDCVMVHRKVKLRYVFEVEVEVVHDAKIEHILFHRGESSWCANNAMDDLRKQAEKDGCLCWAFKCEFVGEVDQTPTREVHTEEKIAENNITRQAIKDGRNFG